jgi:ribosome maturation protein SDO1
VLQINNVFVNVSKGEVANAEDLKKAFGKAVTSTIVQEVSRQYIIANGTTNHGTLVVQILKKGELQVGDRERAFEQENLWRELATMIAEKCVDPSTQRHYPVSIIQKAMSDSGFSLKADKSAKSQVWSLYTLNHTFLYLWSSQHALNKSKTIASFLFSEQECA